jgi:hypothetical protein
MEFISSSTVAGTALSLGNNVTANVDSVWTLALLAVSVPLAFYIIKALISLFPKHRGR